MCRKTSKSGDKYNKGGNRNDKGDLIHKLITLLLASPNNNKHPDNKQENETAGKKYRLP